MESGKMPGEGSKNNGHDADVAVKRSGRCIKRSAKYDSDDCEPQEKTSMNFKPVKRCPTKGCAATTPICFAKSTEKCCGSGYTSRWYHMSSGEHFCNECFEHFYRGHKEGYNAFADWKMDWSTYGRSEPTTKAFMSDKMLPYWLQCNKPPCRRWRQMTRDAQVTSDLVRNYVCGMSPLGVKKEKQYQACSVPEDERVQLLRNQSWYCQLTYQVYLHSFPGVGLLADMFPDSVGLSCTDPIIKQLKAKPVDFADCSDYARPFSHPEEPQHALSFHASIMENDEIDEFPVMANEHSILYLALRNFVMVQWARNTKEWLTVDKIVPDLICRGITRIRCVEDLDRIIWYLTRKGFINTGLLSPPTDLKPQTKLQKEVLIIGGGMSGLAAARALKNYGCKAVVLESQNRLGGRVHDDTSLGVVVGQGAQLLAGCYNNPVAIMCSQAGMELTPVREHCPLITEDGHVVTEDVDRRIDFHFNAMLDIIAEWRKNKDITADVSLFEKFYEMHQQFVDESQIMFTKQEEQVLQFHISNLEYACGGSLNNVSALSWDQNEALPQFAGSHIFVKGGYSQVLNKMAEGLDVRLNHHVSKIDFSSDPVVVTTTSGQVFQSKAVIMSVPLSTLKNHKIQFQPHLPERKLKAVIALGAGLVEKVALKFDKKFWNKKTKGEDFFGHVPPHESKRGLFSTFYDLSTSKTPDCKTNILVTHITGDALTLIEGKKDAEIVKMCVAVLRKLFPEESVPEPSQSFVTHWRDPSNTGMVYSYLPVGREGAVYDALAEDVEKKIFFCGEATNRQFPQTVTGAYLSGIREAEKVLMQMIS
ncbi:lysine-specific histone demethylase 1B-like [Haliotis rufescens]|uniref:lysine-specific histone demethylase 1B-like n=1 Tax=Haliotis rufescens TaxID=6454 RepID=UPI001EAFCD4C|nr:lysine-specific histone demethylase 1B-like [Haliotis rufescens]